MTRKEAIGVLFDAIRSDLVPELHAKNRKSQMPLDSIEVSRLLVEEIRLLRRRGVLDCVLDVIQEAHGHQHHRRH